jgi:uncharacterized protein YqeY
MALTEQINKNIITAMKAKDQVALRGLRAIKSALLLAATEKDASATPTEAQEIAVLQKLMKQRTDARNIYITQNRPDLAEKEQEEMDVIEKYLPEALTADALEALLKNIIAQTGATDIKNMGKIMAVAQPKIAGRADNKTVSDAIKRLLAS